jgi:hypothetical protein
MKRDPLDPRTQTDGQSPDAKRSTANDAKIPPAEIDSKVGIEEHEVGNHVDADVEAGTRNAKDPVDRGVSSP